MVSGVCGAAQQKEDPGRHESTCIGPGGECLSEEYKGANTPLRWRCGRGHLWSTSYANVEHNGTWCPDCAGYKPPHLTIGDAQTTALERGGECLSSTYDNSATKLAWQCAEGHKWLASYNHVGHLGHWCPYCLYKNEGETRACLEDLLCRPFPKARPGWLQGLELDGYNEDLRLAFEYQGRQHDEYTLHFHRGGPADLERQQCRDATKAELCHEEWVTLIVVPHTVGDKRAFLQAQLEALGYLRGGQLAV